MHVRYDLGLQSLSAHHVLPLDRKPVAERRRESAYGLRKFPISFSTCICVKPEHTIGPNFKTTHKHLLCL